MLEGIFGNQMIERIFFAPERRTKEGQELVLTVWKQLTKIHRMSFVSSSRSSGTGWSGQGAGDVRVEYDGNSTLLFHETGCWEKEGGQTFRFSNTFRWSLNRIKELIGLEHLRYGVKKPVFLFYLAPTSGMALESVHSHICGEDTYFGKLINEQDKLLLHWRILGPKKNEEIDYAYFPPD